MSTLTVVPGRPPPSKEYTYDERQPNPIVLFVLLDPIVLSVLLDPILFLFIFIENPIVLFVLLDLHRLPCQCPT